MIAWDLPTKSANTWEVDSKGDLNEDEGKETSELGGEGGGGGKLGGDEGRGEEEDRREEKTLIMIPMMMMKMMMMAMIRMMAVRMVESGIPRWGDQVVDIARKK